VIKARRCIGRDLHLYIPKEGRVGWIAFLFALVAGAAIAVQAGSNSQLKQSLGDPISALVVNYVLGLISAVLVAVMARVSVPAAHKVTLTPWWAWMGGQWVSFTDSRLYSSPVKWVRLP
jgi:uncharacterized membrane protein YdcZ (DUF606 family)